MDSIIFSTQFLHFPENLIQANIIHGIVLFKMVSVNDPFEKLVNKVKIAGQLRRYKMFEGIKNFNSH